MAQQTATAHAIPRTRLSWRARLRRITTPAIFTGPAFILVLLFFFLPVILTIIISLTDMSVATISDIKFVGLKNYVRIWKSRTTWKILKNTFIYVGFTLTFFNVGLALVLSLMTTHMPDRAGTAFRTFWLLPRITPSVIYAIMWTWFTADAPYGIVNQFLTPLGIEPKNWLTAQPWLVVIAANGFVGTSFGMIIFTSAIRSIPVDFLRAALVDGASTWQRIRYVILPMIRWPILFVISYQTLSLLASFEYILLLTDGGPGFYTTEVWSLYAYHRALSNYFGNVQFGFGAALAAVLVVIGVVASVIYLRVFQFSEMVAEPKIEVL